MTTPGAESPRTESGDLLTEIVLRTFRLNGVFLAAAERIAQPAGLTAATWQVLGAVLPQPAPVSGIARTMGLSRQSVQRMADLLVERGMAEYRPNPAHQRAKLLCPTESGWAAIATIRPAQAAWANSASAEFSPAELRHTLEIIDRITRTTAVSDGQD